MEKLLEIYQSFWRLVRELEVEVERYDDLSQEIFQMSLSLFDQDQNKLSPDAYEKYLRITKAQPRIKLQLTPTSLLVERDLLVHSLTNAHTTHVIRSLAPYGLVTQTPAEVNTLSVLNMLYEEFESSFNPLAQSVFPAPAGCLNLAQFKFFLSFLYTTLQQAKPTL